MFTSIAKRTTTQSIRSFSVTRSALSGTVGSGSKSFNEKEQAQENQYIKQHEQEKLESLRKALAEQKETIEKLTKDVENLKK